MSQEQDRTDGTSKVKVTILASEWGSSKGGLSTINRELAIQLAKCPEVEITFFLPQCSEEDKKVAVKHGIKIVEATRLAGYEKLEWVSSPPEDLQIDIVVGHGVILGRQAQVIKRIKKCKWVQVVHTDPEELSMFKDYSEPISKGEEKHKIEVELCEMADQVVAVGPKLSQAFRSYLRGCQKHENVLDFTPGVFEEFVSVKQVTDEGTICMVLVFGRGDAEDFALKGFDIAGKAVAALSDTRLLFVGAPDGKQEEIKNRLTGSGVPASRLRVRSYVQNRESLKRLFQEVDLVLMPSRTEGFGLTGLEAMSAGLPVLVSQNSGFGETLSNVPFGSSYVIDSEDPKDWAAAIKKIWDKDRKMRLQEAEILRDSYQKKYNWTKQIKDLLNKMISMVHADSSDGQSSKQTKSGMLPSAGQDSQRIEDMTEHHTDKSIFSDLQKMQSDADKVYNKTNLSVDLRKIASDKGFIISDNRASGNCMFYALSKQLQSVRGIQIPHRELRRTLVQFLRDNANLRDGTPLFNFVCGYPSWPKYLEGMAKDGTWGDNLVLCAAANCFQTHIRIISSLGRDFVISSDGPVAHTNPLVLGHVHEEHYVSLQPRQGDFDPTEHINQIRQLYTRREGWLAPFPWCEDFHFHLNDIFTRLVMVSKEKKARGTAASKIVEMYAIFQPREECPKPKKVLIEGKPGMGKTTYCNKVAYDWATKKDEAGDNFPNFQVVLLLKCRDIRIEFDLWAIIDDQLLPRDIQAQEKEKFFEFIRRNQSNVLLVLDGLDELPSRKLPETVSEIIQGRMLPDCHLLVTARQEAGILMRKVCDTLLEIEGFTQEDAKRYIFKYFKGKKDLAEKLVHKLEKDKNLQEMMANPLNTALLCLLCDDLKGIFPESRTQVYLDMVQCVLIRYRKKKGLLVNSEDLMEIYNVELKHLGSIALNGLREDNMYFEDKQLGNHTSDLPGFGFLSVQPGSSKRRPSRCYGFLHKTFQELFAAYFLCCQLLSKEISPESIAGDKRYYGELKQVLLFTCGLLAVQSEETAVALIKSITNQVNKEDREVKCFPVALECIGECKKEQSEFYVQLTRTFGSCLKVHSVNLRSQEIGDGNAAVLASLLETNTTLTELGLSNNNLGAAGANALATALKTNTTLTALYLSRNNLGADGAAALASALKTNTTLTELDLSNNNLGAAGANALATALATALKTNTTLTSLYLRYNNLGADGAAALASALKTNTTLTLLDLSNNNLGADGAAALASALKTNTTLTALYLSRNNLGADAADALATALKTNTTLTKLYLSDNNLGADAADAADALASALKTNTTLSELYLSNNNLGADAADALASALKTNTTLTLLDLSNNNLGDDGAAALASALKTNTTLTGLFLNDNNLGDDTAAALASALKTNTTLTVLYLHNNDLGNAGGALFADVLNTNSTLTLLVLIGNNISDPVVINKLREAGGNLKILELS